MSVLNAHNFLGAVNTTPHPEGKPALHTIDDLLCPSFWKYGGFPLFLRKYPSEIAAQDIALNVFVGKPVLVVDHHEIFKDPQPLIQVVKLINSIVPRMRWASVQTAVENSYLSRVSSDRVVHIRPASKTIQIENHGHHPVTYSIEWDACQSKPEKVLVDREDWRVIRREGASVHLTLDLPAGASRRIEIIHKNEFGLSDANQQVDWRAKALVRRRLSDIRDNVLCRYPRLLAVAKTVLGKGKNIDPI